MSGLRLGDIVLDPKGMLYLPQQKALICSGLKQAISNNSIKSVKQATACVELALQKYVPETIIVLGPLDNKDGLEIIAKKWGRKHSFIFVCSKPDEEVIAHAESLKLKFDVQQEFVWDKFRFIEKFEKPIFLDPKDIQTMDMQFTTIAGGSEYFVRIGKMTFDPLGLFTGEKLGIFLRGFGRVLLPSLDTTIESVSIFTTADEPFFERYDVFAMGHSRILPLGKVLDLKKYASKDALPVSRKAFGTTRVKKLKVPESKKNHTNTSVLPN